MNTLAKVNIQPEWWDKISIIASKQDEDIIKAQQERCVKEIMGLVLHEGKFGFLM